MNRNQREFIDALKVWDPEGMASALVRIAEELGNVSLADSTKVDLGWDCREILETLRFGSVGRLLGIPEIPTVLVLLIQREASGGAIVMQWYPEWHRSKGIGSGHSSRFLLSLKLSVDASGPLRERWGHLDFSSDEISLERGEIRTPWPLKGEPGFKADEERKPSIHRPTGVLKAPKSQTYAHSRSIQPGSLIPFLDRYRNGECERVWAEITALGPNVRGEHVLGDAVAVARETMQRCRKNVEQLVSALRKAGYKFRYPDEAYVPASPKVLDQIAILEDLVGPMPISLCAWYEIVGSVNLMGSYPSWGDTTQFFDPPDPMVMYPSKDVLTYDEDNWYRGRYHLDLAPDLFHKEDVSGGPAYAITLPNAAADAPFENERNETTFVNYLRICFRLGGFPGWAVHQPEERPTEMLREISKGLVPI